MRSNHAALWLPDPARLAAPFARWVQQALLGFGSADVLRFLGRNVPLTGNSTFAGQVLTDLKLRPEIFEKMRDFRDHEFIAPAQGTRKSCTLAGAMGTSRPTRKRTVHGKVVAAAGTLLRPQTAAEEEMVEREIAACRAERRRKRQ